MRSHQMQPTHLQVPLRMDCCRFGDPLTLDLAPFPGPNCNSSTIKDHVGLGDFTLNFWLHSAVLLG